MRQKIFCAGLAGLCAGAVNGLFGAGGGMVLVPLLSLLCRPREEELFPSCVAIILPICLVSLVLLGSRTGIPWADAAPYLIGSGIGGILAGFFGRRIPVRWLHCALGGLILWGGVRFLC